MFNRFQTITASFLLLAVLTACAQSQQTPTPAHQTIPTIEPSPIGTCGWRDRIEVWEDTNGDGVREPGEPPMRDIRVITLYKDQQLPDMDELTRSNGEAEVGVVSTICDWENYQVMLAGVPEGYTYTTKQSLRFTERNEGAALQFGLAPRQESTPTAMSTGTAEPTLVAAGFGDCDVLSRAQAETILGPLAYDPETMEWTDPDAPRAGMCFFTGSLNTADVAITWFDQPADAQAFYDQPVGEPIFDIGDKARWDKGQLTLYLLRDKIVVIIHMGESDNAREQAIQIAQIAAVRIP